MKPWHETNLDEREVVSLMQIMAMLEANNSKPFSYAALRRYANGSRTNQKLGAMPKAVAFVAGRRRLYLRIEIEAWLRPYLLKKPDERARAVHARMGSIAGDGRNT